jgi:hypothetical protein
LGVQSRATVTVVREPPGVVDITWVKLFLGTPAATKRVFVGADEGHLRYGVRRLRRMGVKQREPTFPSHLPSHYITVVQS